MTITCPSCKEPAPPQAKDPRFCYSCGKPVSQLCPYEEDEGPRATRLPLFTDARVPTSCGGCGGLLKRCSQCFRLYRLEDSACKTPGCTGLLLEATRMFPVAGEGSIDGTRAMECPKRFAMSFNTPLSVQDTDDVQKLAYRYGLLVGVSKRDLLAFTWSGTTWEPRKPGRVMLVPNGSLAVKSLILDEGLAFVLAEDRAITVRLTEMQLQETYMGRFTLQAKSDLGWFRILETLPGQNTSLIVTDFQTGKMQTIPLPVSSVDINAITAVEPIVIATKHGLLLRVDLQTEQVTPLPETSIDWRRLAVLNDEVIALGYNPNREPQLLILRRDRVDGPIPVKQASVQANFAWVGDAVYMVGSQQIFTASAQLLSQKPTQINLREGQETQEDFLALSNALGERRLLIRRQSGNTSWLYLVDPQSGQSIPLGTESISRQQVTLTGDHAVIATREGQGCKLRTYALGGNS